MAKKRLRQELPADFFATGDTAEHDPRVQRVLQVKIEKLPHGAHVRVRAKPMLQQADRVAAKRARAHAGEGALPAQAEKIIARTAKAVAKGQPANFVDQPDGASAYVAHLTSLMVGGGDYERKQAAARGFFSILGQAKIDPAIAAAAQAYVHNLDADGLLRLIAIYAQVGAWAVCPTGHLVRQLFRHANPAALLPADNAYQVLVMLTDESLGFQSHRDLFWALPDCAQIVLDHLEKFEQKNPKHDAPAEWIRPSGIGRVFLQAFLPDAAARLGPSLQKRGLPKKTMPVRDRPDLQPLAEEALNALIDVVQRMPSRRARRRSTRVRPREVLALRRACAAVDPSLQPRIDGRPKRLVAPKRRPQQG